MLLLIGSRFMDKLVTLSFLKAGMLTTVQDRGRWGYQAYGVPIGGAMDRRAAQMANELVRNSIDTPVLEITLLGPSIQVDQTVQIAITGANLSPTINRQPISCYETITLQEKDILSFGRIIRGCRAYLAIRGNWQLPKWLGSYSAVHPNKEVLPESIIKKGDILKVLTTSFSQVIKLASPSLPTVHPITSVRVLVGQ